MKAVKLKRFFLWVVVLTAAIIVSAFVASISGVRNSDFAAAAEEKPKIVLSSNPAHLNKADPYQEFTVTVRIEDVAKVAGGMYGGNVLITPTEAGILDFVRFVESSDVAQSKLWGESKHNEEISVQMEGINGNHVALTEDFNVGSYVFKLKESVTDIPDFISFTYQDMSCAGFNPPVRLYLAGGTFTINYVEPEQLEDVNTLSALTISAGNEVKFSGTGANQTISTPISYNDRGNLTISATREGAASTIKVVDSVGNATLVSERTEDLDGYDLGTLAAGNHTLTVTVTSEAGNSRTYVVAFTIAEEETENPDNPDDPYIPDIPDDPDPDEPEDIDTLGALWVSVGNTTVLSGTDASQTVSAPIAYNDRGNIKLTVYRDGEKSTVKVVGIKMKGNGSAVVSGSERTLIGERESDLYYQSLGTFDAGRHKLEITVKSEAGTTRTYTVFIKISVENVRIVLSATPSQLSKSNPYREFTVTARMEGVSSVSGGVFAGTVLITPAVEGILDFVEFVPSTDVAQSKLLAASQDREGKNVLIEGGNGPALTEDFTIGSYTFRLKSGITNVPNSITFNYEDRLSTSIIGVVLYLESGTFTVNITDAPDEVISITKPVATVTQYGYSGRAQDFTPEGMEELVSSGKVELFAVAANGAETAVSIDAFTQTNAGSYQIVARPAAGFCWEGASGTAAQTYSFTVNKAPIAAIPAAEEGKLPMFRSDSYQGSLEDVVTYKYYSDEACEHEVAPSDLKSGKSYFFKAVLKEGAEANFAFDPGAVTQVYVSSGSSFIPEIEKTGPSTGVIVGIAVGVAVALGAVCVIVLVILKKKKGGKEGANAAKGKR